MKVKPLSRVRLAATPGTAAPGSSVHGIFQARLLEWGATAFSEFQWLRLGISVFIVRSFTPWLFLSSCPNLGQKRNRN